MLTFFTLNERYLPRDDARLYLQQVADLGNVAGGILAVIAGIGLARACLASHRPQ